MAVLDTAIHADPQKHRLYQSIMLSGVDARVKGAHDGPGQREAKMAVASAC